MKGDPLGKNIPVGAGISLAGSYRLVISIVNPDDPTNEQGDFIDNDCFDFILFDEHAGFRLPMVRLGFRLFNYDILSYLNQGNILRIYLTSLSLNADGSTKEEVGISSDFILLKPNISSDANMKKVLLTGVLNNVAFLNNRYSRTFKDMTSKDVFYWIASQYFTPDFGDDPSDPDDKQSWIQSNQSDKDFMKHLFTFSNYENSFPIIGITVNGTFRHRNFKYYVTQKEPSFRFLFSEAELNSDTIADPEFKVGPEEITHNGDISDISNAGLLNLWRSSGVQIPVINLSSGGNTNIYEGSADIGLLSGTKTGNRSVSLTPAILSIEYESDNTYPGFYESKSRNISGATIYSSQVVSFSYKWKLLPIQVLDYIYLEEPAAQWSQGDSAPKLSPLASATSSGKYIICRITRKITQKGVLTRVEVCRESPAEQIGALK